MTIPIIRNCPDCHRVLDAGHARCHPCFMRYQRDRHRQMDSREAPQMDRFDSKEKAA